MQAINSLDKNISLFLVAFLLAGFAYAQKFEKGILIDNNNTTIEGKFFIDNDSYKVIQKEKKEFSEYFFTDIKSFQRDGVFYKEISFDDKYFLVKHIVSGKANLYQLSETEFFVEKGRHVQKLYAHTDFTIAALQKLFEDCEDINSHIESQLRLDKFAIARVVNHYNHCGLPYEEFIVDDREIFQALNVKKDNLLFKFTSGVGVNTLTLFDDGKNMSVANFHFGAGAMYSPNFFGVLQNRLYFNVDAMYSTSSEKFFTTNTLGDFDIEVEALKFAFGWYMHFNTSKKLQPYAGMDLLFQRDFYKGIYEQKRFHTHIGLSHFMPTLGVRYKTTSNYFSLSASYIPQYENNSSFRDTDDNFIPLQVFSEQFVFIIAFYF
jgi:hypothetical protein